MWSIRSQGPRCRLGRTGPLSLLPYTAPIHARHTHLYVVGTTGMGKSKFLEDLMVQDIHAGRAVGLVDPHTDLSQDTLAHLASVGYFADEAAYQQVIYLDPTRTDYLIPFNILKSDLPAYTIAQMVIEAFRRTWPQALAEAPRFSNIALVSLLVLIETGQTLVQLPRLLTDVGFRKGLLARVRDHELVDYFTSRFDRWSRDVAVMIEPVLNKVTAFTFNPYLKRMLGAAENRLDFRQIMDAGQSLIVDVGRCDGETRRLLGSLIVTGMEQAALTRREGAGRRPFYLFLDEFQDFSAGEGGAKTLAQILSECRKVGLYLHLAHQTLGQLHERLVSALGNVGIKVVFAVEREDAAVLAPKLFAVDLEAVKHQAQTETQHPVYAPLPEQWEGWVASLQHLKPRQAWVKVRGQGPVRIRTEPIPPYQIDREQIEQVRQQLARTHGVTVAELDQTSTRPLEPVKVSAADWENVNTVTTVNTTVYDTGAK